VNRLERDRSLLPLGRPDDQHAGQCRQRPRGADEGRDWVPGPAGAASSSARSSSPWKRRRSRCTRAAARFGI